MKKSCVMVGTLLLASLGASGCVADSVDGAGEEDALGEAAQALTADPEVRNFGTVSGQSTVWSSVVVDSQGASLSGCQCSMSSQYFGFSNCPTSFQGTRTVNVSFAPPSTPGAYIGTLSIMCSGSVSGSSYVKAVVPIGANHNGTLLRVGGAKKAGGKAGRRARTAAGAAPSSRRPR